jgi:hypothetical protein
MMIFQISLVILSVLYVIIFLKNKKNNSIKKYYEIQSIYLVDKS